MDLDADAAYLAIKARDARFDGRVFVGVTSTGIYCRPICRVRTPKRENCRFFETPAQAEAQSFRPCLKCRPEIAPGAGLAWSVMDASRTLAQQAAAWLDSQAAAAQVPRVAELAAHLGVSERHLRRIFCAEHGATPMQYLQTRRLLTAKHLLTDTIMPVSQVALASGFSSVRRFNAAFAQSYRMNPSGLRKDAAVATAAEADAVVIKLNYRAPYDVEQLMRFLGQRAIPGVEQVQGREIRRGVRAGVIAEAPGWIAAEFVPAASCVQVRFAPAWARHSAGVIAAVRRWLDLDAAPATIDAALTSLPRAEGVRLPGSIDAFELAVRAVLGQQVTVAAARTLAQRLVGRFGAAFSTPWTGVDRVFAQPEQLARASLDDVAALGIIRTRAAAIIELARAWPELSRRLAPRQPPQPFIDALCQLPGVGPWTAHYIAMRALSWPDAFLPNDVALSKAMKILFNTASPREADRLAAAWQPWRSYAVLRLWKSLETLS